MSFRLYTPVYALTLLVSAALLFSIQPLFSKMILPLLGGTPQVWNTAMLFFQVCLLGGYGYAHLTTKFLSVRAQSILHVVLLGVFTIVLPIAIPEGWTPPVDEDPTLWQLSLMAVTIGGPFFVLAGSAPMLQRWFANTDHPHADNPYFLYGASNLGSMTSLLAYPTIIEPMMTLSEQSHTWSFGYFSLIGFVALSGLLVWNAQKTQKAKPRAKKTKEVITWGLRGKWMLLAFIPSSLMLGVTTFITTDIASVPLLWILPLALYVGTFIIVFARKPIISLKASRIGFEILLLVTIVQLVGFNDSVVNPFFLIGLHLTLFFFAAMLAHSELAKARPTAQNLTEFYLLMSVGGALGGFFNAIIAPNFLIIPLEYALVLGLCVYVRFMHKDEQSFGAWIAPIKAKFKTEGLNAFFTFNGLFAAIIIVCAIFAFGIPNATLYVWVSGFVGACLFALSKNRWLFAVLCSFVLVLFPPGHHWGVNNFKKTVLQDRNFFGVIRVVETSNKERILMHGTTNHGAQALDEEHKMTPLSYYSYASPVNDVFEVLNARRGKQNIGVIGLGIGVSACFQKDGREFDFFEIDPDIAAIASNPEYFTYLSDCGSPHEIILGDGRLTIQDKPENYYDMIMIDAFSSDNIPVHLLTAEAIQIYKSRLKKDGTLVLNISNNYIDLEPVLRETAHSLGLNAYARVTSDGIVPGTEIKYYPAHWLVIGDQQDTFRRLVNKGWSKAMPREGVKSWSDQYSNVVSVLGNVTAINRFRQMAPKVTHEKIKMVVDPESNPLNAR